MALHCQTHSLLSSTSCTVRHIMCASARGPVTAPLAQCQYGHAPSDTFCTIRHILHRRTHPALSDTSCTVRQTMCSSTRGPIAAPLTLYQHGHAPSNTSCFVRYILRCQSHPVCVSHGVLSQHHWHCASMAVHRQTDPALSDSSCTVRHILCALVYLDSRTGQCTDPSTRYTLVSLRKKVPIKGTDHRYLSNAPLQSDLLPTPFERSYAQCSGRKHWKIQPKEACLHP